MSVFPVPGSSSADNGAAADLSLKDAIRTAYRNNKQLKIREKDVAIAKAGVLGAKSDFLPNLTVSGEYDHRDAVVAPLAGTDSGRKDLGIFYGYKNDNSVSASVTEKFYDGGADIADLKQARSRFKAEEETLRAARLDIEFESKRLYYGLLLAMETQRITKELYDNAEEHYRDMSARFAQGTVSKFELLQSKVQVSKIMPELVKSENTVRLIAAELKRLIGMDINEEIRLTDKLERQALEIEEQAFLIEAYRASPEIMLKALGIDISRLAIDTAQAGLLPSVSGVFNYSYRSDDIGNMINPRHDNWYIGVKGSVAIFDGFYTKSKVDEARAKYAQAFLEKGDLVDRMTVDIRKGCLDLKQADAIITYEKDNIGEAREALRLARVSFDNGVGTNLDILDSQVSLSQIEMDLAGGIYDHCMARAFLERTMGRELLKEEGNVK